MDPELNCFNSKQHHLSLGATSSGAGAGAAPPSCGGDSLQASGCGQAGRQPWTGTAGGEAIDGPLASAGRPRTQFLPLRDGLA